MTEKTQRKCSAVRVYDTPKDAFPSHGPRQTTKTVGEAFKDLSDLCDVIRQNPAAFMNVGPDYSKIKFDDLATVIPADETSVAVGPSVAVPIGEAAALYAFMGWLTTRSESTGPFSSTHDASSAAQLVNEFCKSQGWEIGDADWHKRLNPYPQGVKKEVSEPQMSSNTQLLGRTKIANIFDDDCSFSVHANGHSDVIQPVKMRYLAVSEMKADKTDEQRALLIRHALDSEHGRMILDAAILNDPSLESFVEFVASTMPSN